VPRAGAPWHVDGGQWPHGLRLKKGRRRLLDLGKCGADATAYKDSWFDILESAELCPRAK